MHQKLRTMENYNEVNFERKVGANSNAVTEDRVFKVKEIIHVKSDKNK